MFDIHSFGTDYTILIISLNTLTLQIIFHYQQKYELQPNLFFISDVDLKKQNKFLICFHNLLRLFYKLYFEHLYKSKLNHLYVYYNILQFNFGYLKSKIIFWMLLHILAFCFFNLKTCNFQICMFLYLINWLLNKKTIFLLILLEMYFIIFRYDAIKNRMQSSWYALKNDKLLSFHTTFLF